MRKFVSALVFLFLACAAAPAKDEAPELESMTVTSSLIDSFKIGSSEAKFGRLEFIGGLEMNSSTRDFGALSAFRFLDKGSRFLGVADTGFWFSGKVLRDSAGKPIGLEDFKMRSMPNDEGGSEDRKWNTDAEGLAVSGSKVTASFERVHRIATGDVDADTLLIKLEPEKLPVPARELRSNRGFETLALSPANSRFEGARIAVTEKSLNKDGNMFAAVMEGPKKGIFYVKRDGEFDITDGDFLPNGDLLLLERQFNMANGIAMQLRLIPGDRIEPGATVDGEVLLDADLAYQIDNMECLDVWQDEAGGTRVTLMSDDNHSILQRNLLLEFKLDE